MPRGNDADAHKDFKDQYGEYQSAGDLIQAARERYPAEFRAANAKTEDVEATEALDLKEVARKAGVKEVISATVRGGNVIYVHEGETGGLRKWFYPLKGDDKAAPPAPKLAVAPPLARKPRKAEAAESR